VHVGGESKLILRDGMAVLMVKPSDEFETAGWAAVDRKALRAF